MSNFAMSSILLLVFSPFAAAISSGLVSECDAKAFFGCPRDKWTNNDRSRCTQKGIMPWAGEPFHSSNYTLRAGDGDPDSDRTTYTPGVAMTLDLRVHHPEMKWRGIIMHAVDRQGKTVGSWEIPQSNVELFQVPPACPGVLAHTDAKEKPFHVGRAHYAWIPPAAGTGTVTFHTLIKQGPANIGEFYYPKTDLILYEKGNEAVPAFNTSKTSRVDNHISTTSLLAEWHVADYGQNCDELCESMDKECDMDAMMHSSSNNFVSEIESTFQCSAVAIKDCSFASPAVATDGQCYFHSSSCTPSESKYANGGEVDSDATVCSASTEGRVSKHFCVCSSALGRLLASPVASLLTIFTMLHLAMGARPSALPSLALLGAGAAGLAMLATPANAHNWAMSRTRSTQIARAGRVCDSRKSGEVHAQVGRNQPFTLQWATGHSRHSYVVVTLGSDEHMQKNSSYLKMIQEYIDEAPADAHLMSTDSKYHRMHLSRSMGSNSILDLGTNSDGQTNPYDKIVSDRSAVHPDTSDSYSVLTTYKQNVIDDDVHVVYHNPKYPWIEAAHRYNQVYSRGGDLDLARVEIPGRNCCPEGTICGNEASCHYVVHWYWSGYSDCVDVDFFPNIQVENVYGVPSEDGIQYQKVDHCQYIKPQKGLSECRLITDNDATPCLNELEQSPYFKGAFRGVPLGSETWRFGVSAVPAVPPKSIPAALRSPTVPWHKGWCAGEATRLEGKYEKKQYDWSEWQEKQAEHKPGKECAKVLWEKNLTFAEAVEECAIDFRQNCGNTTLFPSGALRSECLNNHGYMPQVCYGISFPNNLKQPDLSATYLFKGCGVSSSPVVSNSARQVWNKRNAVAMSSSSGTGPWIRVSFQSKDHPMVRFDGSPASGWIKEDLSETFATRDSNLKYGFNCIKGAPGTSNMYARDGVDTSMTLRDANDQLLTGHFLGWARSVDSTYVDFRINSKCPDTTDRVWEIEVANGIYEVRTNHEVGNDRMAQYSNFVIENVRLPISDFSGQSATSTSFPPIIGHRDIHLQAVEVTDGRLTIRVNERRPNNHGTTINWIQLRRIADVGTQTDAWLPSSENPALRYSLPTAEPIGLVKITLPGSDDRFLPNLPCRANTGSCGRYGPDLPNLRDCRANWFFSGDNKCGNQGPLKPQYVPLIGGKFDKDNQGAVVSVSNDYNFVYREADVCARITTPPVCLSSLLKNNADYTVDQNFKMSDQVLNTFCPIEVNCAGRVGKYVHIVLPGANRILTVSDVEVHRNHPIIPAGVSNPMVCYGVEARQSSALPFPVAEFETTNDPEDAIFYSSCFVRTDVIDWLPSKPEPPSKVPDFVFNGKCLDCDSYKQLLEEANFTQLDVPFWALDDQCEDCHITVEAASDANALAAVGSSLGTLNAVPAENPDGIRGGSSTVVIVLVIVLLLAAAAGGAFYYKKRQAAGASTQTSGTAV